MPEESIKAGGRKILYEIQNLIISIWNKEELLRSGRSRSLYLSIRRVIKQIVALNRQTNTCTLLIFYLLKLI